MARYWFGTNQGISILDTEYDGGSMHDFDELKEEGIEFLKEDRDQGIWIGTTKSGIFNYSFSHGLTRDPRLNRLIGQYKPVMAMDIDQDNFLWVGTLDGLIYYDIENRSVVKMFTQFDDGLKGNQITMLYIDSGDRVWIGHDEKGISLLEGGEFMDLKLGFDFTPLSMAEDRDGTCWIGTEGLGLIRYDPDRRQVIHVYTADGGELLTNLVNQVNVDRFNNIYAGTNKGLNIYFRDHERFYSFTSGVDLLGLRPSPMHPLWTRMGSSGLEPFRGLPGTRPAKKASVGAEPADPYLPECRSIMNQSLWSLDCSLSIQQNSIIFEYRCITLNPDAVQYQIMLEGSRSGMAQPDTQTRETYPALRHGRYTFLVKARNSAGVWNTEPVSFSFVIRPPFYLTWYFILSGSFAVGLLIFSYIKIRERALKRENAILEEKVKDQNRHCGCPERRTGPKKQGYYR